MSQRRLLDALRSWVKTRGQGPALLFSLVGPPSHRPIKNGPHGPSLAKPRENHAVSRHGKSTVKFRAFCLRVNLTGVVKVSFWSQTKAKTL